MKFTAKCFLLIYTLLVYVSLPFVFTRLLWRALRNPAYREGLWQRFGFHLPRYPTQATLVHAVSVGETVAAVPLIQALLQQQPNLPIILTHMTPTGMACGKRLLGDSVTHAYLPYDYPFAIRRFLNAVQPNRVIVMETEWWPHFYLALHARHIPVFQANTRLSARSLQRYLYAKPFFEYLLNTVTRFGVQTADDAERLICLGAHPEQVSVTGNLKWDIAPNAEIFAQAEQWRTQLAHRPVWIAASTHAGEEPIVYAAFQALLQQQPDALLILVPRHPERFDAVYQAVCTQGWRVMRKTTAPTITDATQVFLVDTMGELSVFYGAATIAFVGGSFVPLGGHNLIEAIQMDCAVIMGPFTSHVQQTVDALLAQQAMWQVTDPAALAQTVAYAFAHPPIIQQVSTRASAYLQAQQGATQRTLFIL